MSLLSGEKLAAAGVETLRVIRASRIGSSFLVVKHCLNHRLAVAGLPAFDKTA